jgi:pseudaminic acid cytidylyltransferase
LSKEPRRLAIVPARGGSKRIHQKNISQFHCHPIIYYTLEAAQTSGLFELIHVSTDCDLVREVVKGLGFEPEFLRPIELAADDTPLFPVLRFVVNEFAKSGNVFDEVWLLMPCAPLIDGEDLVSASRLFAQTGGPILSVCEYPAPIEWAYQKSPNGRLHPISSEKIASRSQELGIKYYDAGLFAIYSSEDIMRDTELGRNLEFYGFQIDRMKAVDIDYKSDWEYAEKIFKFTKLKND